MKYIMNFALEHPYLFTLIMIFVSTWSPIRIIKQYGKPPDEFYLHDGNVK